MLNLYCTSKNILDLILNEPQTPNPQMLGSIGPYEALALRTGFSGGHLEQPFICTDC